MIVKILSNGKSFSGLATYLTHDPERAKTAERVAWTHTLNCANDDVPCAVNEMLWTTRDAELLKQEAGIRAGGRSTKNTVKHFSLSWSPQENPTREHMIETTEDFLRHMRWQEHQAVLIAHDDKNHSHVHCMLNVVHPETGLRLNDSFEQVRAQEWALQYEREHGIHCEQRLLDPVEREKNPPRNIWMQFQINEKEFEKGEKSLENNSPIFTDDSKNLRNSEWQILKEYQRNERLEFFAQGKYAFNEMRNSIFREVRKEFCEGWRAYYEARRDCEDPEEMDALKDKLVATQNAVLKLRREIGCAELRESRDRLYQDLLGGQREARAELRWRQEAGLDNAAFLSELGSRRTETELTTSFRDAANEVGMPGRDSDSVGPTWEARDDAERMAGPDDDAGMRNNVRHGLISFFDSLAFDLINLGTGRVPAPPRVDSSGRSFVEIAAEEAGKQRRQRDGDEEDERWRARQRSPRGD